MKVQKQYRTVVSLLLLLVILAYCMPVCAYAESEQYSDGCENGISLSTKVPPSVTSGNGAQYRKGSTGSLSFSTDDTANNLVHILIDETKIPPDSYTVSGEPLTVTLHTDYLDTLCAGEHKIKIVTANGEAPADFTVTDSQNQGPTTYGGKTTVKAVDTESEITTDYKQSKNFDFETEYMPEGATAHVYYNGEDQGEGTSISVREPTGDYTVECKVLDADGNEIASSGEIKVRVKNSFLDKIRWSFNNLPGIVKKALTEGFGKININVRTSFLDKIRLFFNNLLKKATEAFIEYFGGIC